MQLGVTRHYVVNQKANECLNELYRWFIANKLSLNITKTIWCLKLNVMIQLNYIVASILYRMNE